MKTRFEGLVCRRKSGGKDKRRREDVMDFSRERPWLNMYIRSGLLLASQQRPLRHSLVITGV